MLNRPDDVAQAFAHAWSTANADGIAGLFVEDADFVNVVGIWWNTREQIRQGHTYGFKYMFPNSVMTLNKVIGRALGEDHSVVHAAWSMTGQITPAGGPSGARSGIFSFVMAKQPAGNWLAVSAHNTDIVPGAQTHVASDGTLRPESYKQRTTLNPQ